MHHHNQTMSSRREASDYSSSTSDSFTSLESSGSCTTSTTTSPSSFSGDDVITPIHKPHKSTQPEWEVIHNVSVASGGRLSLDHFRVLRRLGSGDLGEVYLCRLCDGNAERCLYAMKVVDREALALRKKLGRSETEREILRTLDHPFLPTLFADFDISRYSCFVMEYCSGGDLHVARHRQPRRRFTISTAKFYAAETILALEYLHMMGVVYRDLKPENILIKDDGHIMLSDFDLSLRCDNVVPKILRHRRPHLAAKRSKLLSCFTGAGRDIDRHFDAELVAEPVDARSKSLVGTHEYLAPEVVTGVGHGSAVDWWALGVFLYEMVYGRTPFKGDGGNGETLANIVEKPLAFPRAEQSTGKELQEELRVQDLISKLLVKNPKKRLGSKLGSVEIKRHQFFKDVNWALIRSVTPPKVHKDARTRVSKSKGHVPFKIPENFDHF